MNRDSLESLSTVQKGDQEEDCLISDRQHDCCGLSDEGGWHPSQETE